MVDRGDMGNSYRVVFAGAASKAATRAAASVGPVASGALPLSLPITPSSPGAVPRPGACDVTRRRGGARGKRAYQP